MADYAIGDLQGHYDGLCRLLDKINYDPLNDGLYFLGDLVNRGSQSLETLRFIKSLQPNPKICLGNHDVYLLYLLYNNQPLDVPQQLWPILKAHDRDELADWLRRQGFLHVHGCDKTIMVHAGIAPIWSAEKAIDLAKELLQVCVSDTFYTWMNHYFNPRPTLWDDSLEGLVRWQLMSDYFTRMRFTTIQGSLNWQSHHGLHQAPKDCYAWFACPQKQDWQQTIVFGHWASLLGKTGMRKIQNIDTGLNWGGTLTALNLHNFQRFSTF